jgi:Recombination endonuclease VII
MSTAAVRRQKNKDPEWRARKNRINRKWAQSPKGRASLSAHYRKYGRRYKLQARYGLTPEAWELLFISQSQCCALCKTTTPGSKGWQTDHDHTVGGVRGILCYPCNVGLGFFKDNKSVLQLAIQYLNRGTK